MTLATTLTFLVGVEMSQARPFPLHAYRPAATERAREITATFRQRSYEPGQPAALLVNAKARRITVQLFRSGPELGRTRRSNVLRGIAVTEPRAVSWNGTQRARTIYLRPGQWPSGFYFAKVTGANGRIAYAPFVLRPNVPGRDARVAAVLPTNTWQAYNLRDVSGDGIGDSWYADPSVRSILLTRPYLNRGVPPFLRRYDLGFIRWVARTGKAVDFFADDDLARFHSGRGLASRYDLIIFPGHEEYVTTHAYDVIRGYRNAGGNLAFLSANNFFYRVDRNGARLSRVAPWRRLGRPEAALVGIQYIGWYELRFANAFYVVRGASRAPWFFDQTSLQNGSRFGLYGIEIDARTSSSPRGTTLLANIPNIFGRGKTAEMTYYETAQGAKVFAAGSLNFGGSAASSPLVRRLLENLWLKLSIP